MRTVIVAVSLILTACSAPVAEYFVEARDSGDRTTDAGYVVPEVDGSSDAADEASQDAGTDAGAGDALGQPESGEAAPASDGGHDAHHAGLDAGPDGDGGYTGPWCEIPAAYGWPWPVPGASWWQDPIALNICELPGLSLNPNCLDEPTEQDALDLVNSYHEPWCVPGSGGWGKTGHEPNPANLTAPGERCVYLQALSPTDSRLLIACEFSVTACDGGGWPDGGC